MEKIKFRKLADKIRNEQWSDQRIKALETLFIHRRSDIKNLLKEIKAYRNYKVENETFGAITERIRTYRRRYSRSNPRR